MKFTKEDFPALVRWSARQDRNWKLIIRIDNERAYGVRSAFTSQMSRNEAVQHFIKKLKTDNLKSHISSTVITRIYKLTSKETAKVLAHLI